eukprot:5964258-Ditylum_brightwellii.AAC.1
MSAGRMTRMRTRDPIGSSQTRKRDWQQQMVMIMNSVRTQSFCLWAWTVVKRWYLQATAIFSKIPTFLLETLG